MSIAIQKNERQSYHLEVEPPSVRAFTLIEVMVVMAIISIMAAVVVSSLGNGRTERELETNAREFASVIREAQNYALTGKQWSSGDTPCSFGVRWIGGSSTYDFTYAEKSGDTCPPSPSSVVAYTLKNGVTFSGGGSMLFTLPHAATSGVNAVFVKGGLHHIVCISADGRVSDTAGSTCAP